MLSRSRVRPGWRPESHLPKGVGEDAGSTDPLWSPSRSSSERRTTSASSLLRRLRAEAGSSVDAIRPREDVRQIHVEGVLPRKSLSLAKHLVGELFQLEGDIDIRHSEGQDGAVTASARPASKIRFSCP